jgi:hypothetical protein
MSRVKAEGLLIRYMRTVWKAAGLQWNWENDDDMSLLMDHLMAAVVDEVNHGIGEHVSEAPHIYPDGSVS